MKKNNIILILLFLAQISKAQHIEFGGGLAFGHSIGKSTTPTPTVMPNGTTFPLTNVSTPTWGDNTLMHLSLLYVHPFYKTPERNFNFMGGFNGNFSYGQLRVENINLPILLNINHKIDKNKSLGTSAGLAFDIFKSKLNTSKYITPILALDYCVNKNIFRFSITPAYYSFGYLGKFILVE
jgi:hypothetical protein